MSATQDSSFTYADLFAVQRRFRRSVNLERDLGSAEALEGYRLTPNCVRTFRRLSDGLDDVARGRAWTVTGPYGSGKSSFLTFLASLTKVGGPARNRNKELRAQLKRIVEGAGETVSASMFGGWSSLVPMVVTAERAPLPAILLRGLECGLRDSLGRQAARQLRQRMRELRERSDAGKSVSTRAVVTLFEEALAYLRRRDGTTGILFIIDEAGKALEYAAHHPTRSDVLLLQELAELSARSEDVPFVFVTVLHQAFSGYAARLGAAQRKEWEKVQGRFEEVSFVESWDQIIRLCAEAIESKGRLPRDVGTRRKQVLEQALAAVELPPMLATDEVRAWLGQSFPLHPYTVIMLGPLFRSAAFQNERSLFGFLASSEPRAFQAFLQARRHRHATYTVADLFDYVMMVMQARGMRMGSGILQAATMAIDRIPDECGDVGVRIVKTIAMLTMLGHRVGMRANAATIHAALDEERLEIADVEDALRRLADASVVVYRRFRDSYLLWEGSDIRIDEAIGKSGAQEVNARDAAAFLNSMNLCRPIVARRHLFETGTLRYFPVRFLGADDIMEMAPVVDGDEDGFVQVVLSSTRSEVDYATSAMRHMASLRDPDMKPSIFAIPRDCTRIIDMVGELRALERIGEIEPAISDDPVAQREVNARKADLIELLRSEVDRCLGARSSIGEGVDWFYLGRKRRVRSRKDLASLVSDVCKEAYHLAPEFHNELVNRRVLSTTAASARRSLLEAMLTRAHEPDLGIKGTPPEKSMYLSVLLAHGLHRTGDDGWQLRGPSRRARSKAKGAQLRGLWSAWEHALQAADGRRVPLEELYRIARMPPFGLKDGVLPILVLHFYCVNESRLGMYYNGSFQPRVTPAVAERLVRAHKGFELQWSDVGRQRARYLARLARDLGIVPRRSETVPTVLDVLREIARRLRGLPPFAMKTRRLSPSALAVREALKMAKEPGSAIFVGLPRAVGADSVVDSETSDEAVEEVASTIVRALLEIEGAYPQLRRMIVGELGRTVGASGFEDAELRLHIRGRAERLLEHAAEASLKSFLIRLADDQLDDDDWLVSVATGVAQKPPDQWDDADVGRYRMEVRRLGRMFTELESVLLAASELIESEEPGRDEGEPRVMRIGVSEVGRPTVERVVAVRPHAEPAMERLHDSLLDLLRQYRCDLTREEQLATMGMAVARLIEELEKSARMEGTDERRAD